MDICTDGPVGAPSSCSSYQSTTATSLRSQLVERATRSASSSRGLGTHDEQGSWPCHQPPLRSLAEVQSTGPPELRGFSRNLHRDWQAVYAGFMAHWSLG